MRFVLSKHFWFGSTHAPDQLIGEDMFIANNKYYTLQRNVSFQDRS